MVKLTPEHFVLTPEGAEKLCDVNTIGEPLPFPSSQEELNFADVILGINNWDPAEHEI